MENKILIGSHVSMSGPDYFLGSVKESIENGATTLMFYTGAPQNNNRTPIENCKIAEGIELLKQNNFDISKIVCHAPYIINLGNTIDENKFSYSKDVLLNELKRTAKFNCNILVLHPGSSLGVEKKAALDKLISGINEVLDKDNTDVKIAIETMAGKTNELGSNFEEIKYILDNINRKDRIGVCLDTCHINDAGYDVSNIDEIISKFDSIIGLSNLLVIHLNDSKNPKGSHKDRHENFGFGYIGFDTLIKYAYDERLVNIPKILETPYINKNSPYKKEISMIKSKKFEKDLFKDFI